MRIRHLFPVLFLVISLLVANAQSPSNQVTRGRRTPAQIKDDSLLDRLIKDKEEGWQHLGNTDDSVFYYNDQRLVLTDSGTIRVWIKRYPKRGSNNNRQGYTVGLFENDCSQQRLRGLSETTYNKSGKAIKKNGSETQWHYPPPGSMMENLLQVACSLNKEQSP